LGSLILRPEASVSVNIVTALHPVRLKSLSVALCSVYIKYVSRDADVPVLIFFIPLCTPINFSAMFDGFGTRDLDERLPIDI
jgi:hypothetical protein